MKPGRDNLVKMLLTSGPVVSTSSASSSGLPSPPGEPVDENPSRFSTFLHHLSGCSEIEMDIVAKDHCYARPWNWRPDNIYNKPVKKLFFPKRQNISIRNKRKEEEEIDVVGIDDSDLKVPLFDLAKSKHLMDESQRLANFVRSEENNDWDEKIVKLTWTPVQNRIFSKVVRVLNAERMARLAKVNTKLEPISRRTSLDIAARRFREILASSCWDYRITQWLHALLFDNLPQEYLAIYVDILQTLRHKIPQLIDKMMGAQMSINSKAGPLTWETLGPILKKSWDPVAAILNSNKPRKLPDNPVLVIAPNGVSNGVSSRQHKWITQLGALGTVVTVHTHLPANRITMIACMDQLIQATRAKIQDVKGDFSNRPIVLVGFHAGAGLACQVAQIEHVSAVVCLGFPFNTAEGKRGAPDDTLMDIKCPVLFVIGQNAMLTSPGDLEDLREKMLVETGLIVVGSADDNLRISTSKKMLEGITQSIVDRCILEEVADFVGSILLQPQPLPLRQTAFNSFDNRNKKEARKRKNSTSSSVESEPHSPCIKKSRPVTPVSVAISNASVVTAGSIPRTLASQSNLANVTGTPLMTAPRRKPRSTANQKTNFSDHLITSRLTPQQNVHTSGSGITLNIGSLASLAPIGPIRLTPTSLNQPATSTMGKVNMSPKISASFPKASKILPTTTIIPQNIPKIKTLGPLNKGAPKALTNNYKHINITEKAGEGKLMDVLTSVNNHIRVNASATSAVHTKSAGSSVVGPMTAAALGGRTGSVGGICASTCRVPPSSTILLTPNNSTTATSTPTTISKVMDMGGAAAGREHSMIDTTHMMDATTITPHPPQTTLSSSIVMITESSRNPRNSLTMTGTALANSTQNSLTILPFTNKARLLQKNSKVVPKITVNNISRIQRSKIQPVTKKAIDNLDDELGNILDIPIIFAKDGENLNNLERISPLPTLDLEKSLPPKPPTATKVVLISNKQDRAQSLGRMQQPAILRPNNSSGLLNQVILRPQNPSASINRSQYPLQAPRPAQPTIKYTKIILAKRNSSLVPGQRNNSEPVILTKNPPKSGASKFLGATPRILATYQDSLREELEDATKSGMIDRRPIIIPEIDLTSPKKRSSELQIKEPDLS